MNFTYVGGILCAVSTFLLLVSPQRPSRTELRKTYRGRKICAMNNHCFLQFKKRFGSIPLLEIWLSYSSHNQWIKKIKLINVVLSPISKSSTICPQAGIQFFFVQVVLNLRSLLNHRFTLQQTSPELTMTCFGSYNNQLPSHSHDSILGTWSQFTFTVICSIQWPICDIFAGFQYLLLTSRAKDFWSNRKNGFA